MVFFETSVLISSSIRGIVENKEIKHPFYDQSKGLISLIIKRDTDIQGVITSTVKNQAIYVIDKAVLSLITEKYKLTDINRKDIYNNFHEIFDFAERQLGEFIESLDLLRTNESIVESILTDEVNPMYFEIEKEEIKYPEKPTACSPKFAQIAREISHIQYKRHQKKLEKMSKKAIYPDPIDLRILSEAIYLKRYRFEDEEMFLASLDNHFSGMSPPYTQIPIEIKKKFEIICEIPIDIIKNLK